MLEGTLHHASSYTHSPGPIKAPRTLDNMFFLSLLSSNQHVCVNLAQSELLFCVK